MMSTKGDKRMSAFKRAQLRHRRQELGDAPDRADGLDDVLDFSFPSRDERIYSIECPSASETDQCFYEGPLFGVSAFPGFLYAPQALAPSLQLGLAFSAVSEYCESPHATNIDLVPPKAGKEENNANQRMWDLWKQDNGYSAASDSLKDTRTINGHCLPLKKYRSFAKLSWSTMGYQYDWTTRAYHEDAKSPVPLLLDQLAPLFARTSMSISNSTSSTNFTTSACIVNYYNTKSTMGGHRDDLELALDKPVISLSLGLPAVFLLGGKTKDDEPVLPILVRPGDVMILGGDSRLCYHGMARVIPASTCLSKVCENLDRPESFQLTCDSILSQCEGRRDTRIQGTLPDSDRTALEDYLTKYRININLRQVLPDDMNRLPGSD